ncbi:MAG TPA: MarR family transcriptional regulator [Anaerolineales bacterium]
MNKNTEQIRKEFIEGLSHISHFWGYPKGVGAVFGVLYLAPNPLSLDEVVSQSGLTKGAVSTNVRALTRLGLVYRSSRLGDRKDYYVAETDFYKSIRAILGERQNREFDQAIRSVNLTLEKLKSAKGSMDEAERKFLVERVQALQDFFSAIDSLSRAAARLDNLGVNTIQNILKILK